MIGYLEQLQERAIQAQANLGIAVGQILTNNEQIGEQVVQLNKDQLYEFGEDARKQLLPLYRSIYYADMKAELRGGRELTDLFLTGAFQDGFYLVVDGDTYYITSNDSKTQKLIEKYGENIFGLTDENKQVVYLLIKPELQDEVMQYLKYGEAA